MEDKVWKAEYSIDTSASAKTIWKLFCDVPGWKEWNAGIESIKFEGPFQLGASFVMKPPGEEPVQSKIIELRVNECFVDETKVGDIVVTVNHQILPLDQNTNRVIYSVEVDTTSECGPSPEEVGKAVSADFPEVLKALVTLAHRRERACAV